MKTLYTFTHINVQKIFAFLLGIREVVKLLANNSFEKFYQKIIVFVKNVYWNFLVELNSN